MKDTNDTLKAEKSERMARWDEYFKRVLNREEPMHPAADKRMEMIKEK